MLSTKITSPHSQRLPHVQTLKKGVCQNLNAVYLWEIKLARISRALQIFINCDTVSVPLGFYRKETALTLEKAMHSEIRIASLLMQ